MRNVLVIEDSADLRSLIKLALSREGYDVSLASNGREALEILKDGRMKPDLILLDLLMPIMGGAAFLAEQKLHSEIANIPVVVCSGTRMDVPEQVGYLKKPIELTELIQVVQKHCN